MKQNILLNERLNTSLTNTTDVKCGGVQSLPRDKNIHFNHPQIDLKVAYCFNWSQFFINMVIWTEWQDDCFQVIRFCVTPIPSWALLISPQQNF